MALRGQPPPSVASLKPPRLLSVTSIALSMSLIKSLVPEGELGKTVPWIVIRTFAGGVDVMSLGE